MGVPLIKETTTCDQTQTDLKALTVAVCQGLRSVLPEGYQSELYIFRIVGNPIPQVRRGHKFTLSWV